MNTFSVADHKGEFFSVLETTENSQVAAMTISPGEDSGAVGNHIGDQVIYCIEGKGEVEIAGERHEISSGEAITIPAKTDHKAYNTGQEDFFFVNVYAPPAY